MVFSKLVIDERPNQRSGASGEVNLYFNKGDRAQYAVKKLWVKNKAVEETTRKETDLLRRLKHPGIVQYHSYHQERVNDTLFAYIGVSCSKARCLCHRSVCHAGASSRFP